MNYNCVIVRYGEIGTKKPPVRTDMESQLVNNISDLLNKKGIDTADIYKAHGRIIIYTKKAVKACGLLKKVFGVVSSSPSIFISQDYDSIKKTALKMYFEKKGAFRITARRITKEFPKKSPEINAEIGEYVINNSKAKVNLTNPDVNIGIEFLNKKTYLFYEYYPGPGGLPAGVSGKVVQSFSDSFDLLSAWMMLKRGSEIVFICEKQKINSLNKFINSWCHGIGAVVYLVSKSSKTAKINYCKEVALREHAFAVSTSLDKLKDVIELDKLDFLYLHPVFALTKKLLKEFSSNAGLKLGKKEPLGRSSHIKTIKVIDY